MMQIQGHKRWDKAVVSGLESLRGLVHENFLPALERCSVILSRLRGLAQFYDTRDDIGFSVAQINRVTDIISCLTLVGHKILVLVMDELEHFTSFSTWLRFQIDRLASSSAGEELTEKEATMDNGKILTYIQRYLTQSPLDNFFDDVAKDDYSADWQHIEDGASLLEVLDKQLKKREQGQPSMKALPHVDFLVKYLTTRSDMIFKGIAEAKKRSVRLGKPMTLSTGRTITKMDVRMCEDDGKVWLTGIDHTCVNVTDVSNRAARCSQRWLPKIPRTKVLPPRGKQARVSPTALTRDQVYIFRASFGITNGISSNQPVTACYIDLHDRKLVDLKFLNDQTLILVCNEPGSVSRDFQFFVKLS